MSENSHLHLPESHLNILHVVSAIAWADGDLSIAEINLLIEQFKSDLPINPSPVAYLDDNMSLYDPFSSNPMIYGQIEARMEAESAFKKILNDYHENPVSLEDLVLPIKTMEDRCLAAKLGYMVIKASGDNEGNLICPQEKAVYRKLIQLLKIDNELAQKIEWEADEELDKFQHPFKAFMNNVKTILLTNIN